MGSIRRAIAPSIVVGLALLCSVPVILRGENPPQSKRVERPYPNIEKLLEQQRAKKQGDFKSQKKRDQLRIVTTNTFLESDLKPLPGAWVLIAIQVVPWEKQHPLSEGFGGGEAGASVLIKVTSGAPALVPISALVDANRTNIVPQSELDLTTGLGPIVAAWVILPPDGKKVELVCALSRDGARGDFADTRVTRLVLRGQLAPFETAAMAGDYLAQRAKSLLEGPNYEELGESVDSNGQTEAGGLRIRRVMTPKGLLVESVVESGGGNSLSSSAETPISTGVIPRDLLAKKVKLSNWFATHWAQQDRVAIVRVGHNAFASLEEWDHSAADGASRSIFLYTHTGLVVPSGERQRRAAMKSKEQRVTESEGFSEESGGFKSKRRLKWSRK